MSKYFSNDISADFEFELEKSQTNPTLNYSIDTQSNKDVSDKLNNLDTELTKQKLSQQDELETKIEKLVEQNKLLQEALNEQLSKNAIEEIEEKKKEFLPVDLFEKMNQLIYLQMQENKRITALEKSHQELIKIILEMKENKVDPVPEKRVEKEVNVVPDELPTLNPNPKKEKTARELFEEEIKAKQTYDLNKVEDVRRYANDIKKGEIPDLPELDKPIEEIFPNAPEEALEIIYKNRKGESF